MKTLNSSTNSNLRLLILGLDGLEQAYANELMDAGEMPALAALRERSAAFLLEHGPAMRAGLAGEHFASGLSPQDANRWSAVEFDPATYQVWQEGARFTPFLEEMDLDVTVFDANYVDLRYTERMNGLVGWGAHDAGTAMWGRPTVLAQDFMKKFGDYPARRWLYATPCYSAKRCEQAGEELAKAVDTRREAALWLMSQQPSEVFFAVTGEIHGAIEGLWHGVDPHHPLHQHPSAPAAAAALLKVHKAVDRMIEDLVKAVGDEVDIVTFAMGGMGINLSDLQSMVLLPELLYRHAFNESLLQVPDDWAAHPKAVPEMSEDQRWARNPALLETLSAQTTSSVSLLQKAKRKVGKVIARSSAASTKPIRDLGVPPASLSGMFDAFSNNIDWQPATCYQPWWHQMKAFALPSFFDGRVRINLEGREKEGIVPIEDYGALCLEIETLVLDCRDPRTGKPVVDKIERPTVSDPLQLNSSDADLVIIWNAPSNAMEHPSYGLIGPVAYRRTGGHTGPYGIAYFAGENIRSGFYGHKSSLDLAPTVIDRLNLPLERAVSGKSFLNCCLGSPQ